MSYDVGIEKEVDTLGRIVIPKEIRERFNIKGKVEILLTQDGVLIRNPKYALVSKEDENYNEKN
jgi:AbrB family looped-hinge helix DNA binding protein